VLWRSNLPSSMEESICPDCIPGQGAFRVGIRVLYFHFVFNGEWNSELWLHLKWRTRNQWTTPSISVTLNLAKVTEYFTYREVLKQINPSLDPFQYGCLKGSSPTHYLVRRYRLITEWLDKGSTIVDVLLADYHKAFNLIPHIIALHNLKQMGLEIKHCFW